MTLSTFKSAKHTVAINQLVTDANRQAFQDLLRCGSVALHYLCTSLNPHNLFMDTELWLTYFELEPTGNAAKKIN